MFMFRAHIFCKSASERSRSRSPVPRSHSYDPAMMHRAHEMIQRAALAASPDAPALIIGKSGEQVTYAALMQRALNIAEAIAPHVAGKPNALTGIFQERSINFFATVIGVLSAGCCYVPVSTKYGNDRIEYILGFAKPVVVLSYAMYAEQLAELSLTTINVDGIDYSQKRDASRSAAGDADGRDMAYVIFTSGTTGRPKGVMVEHKSLCNMMREKHDAYAMAASDRLLQFYDVAFDGSIIDYMPTLSCGSALILWSGDLEQAIKAATKYGATHTMLTTSAMALFPCAPHWKIMSQGGEACPVEMATLWSGHCTFQNFYGPTEATGFVTWKAYKPGEKALTIGQTVRDSITVVLDEERNEVAPGTVGELCFGGVCLARGYWEDQAKTDESFFVHPKYGRLYASGDLGMIDAAGTEGGAAGDIFIRGRRDEQVKIRGVRIELQEVEQVIAEHPCVSTAACVMHKETMMAFVVPNKGETVKLDEIIALCKSRVAEQAVPETIVPLKKMPRTASDKVDKRELTRPIAESDEGVWHARATHSMCEVALNLLHPVKGVACVEFNGKSVAYVGVRSKDDANWAHKALTRYLEMKVPSAYVGEWVMCDGAIPQQPPAFYEQACKVREMPIGQDQCFHFCGADHWDTVVLSIYSSNSVVEFRKVPTRIIPDAFWEKAKWVAAIEKEAREPNYKMINGKKVELLPDHKPNYIASRFAAGAL